MNKERFERIELLRRWIDRLNSGKAFAIGAFGYKSLEQIFAKPSDHTDMLLAVVVGCFYLGVDEVITQLRSEIRELEQKPSDPLPKSATIQDKVAPRDE